LLKTFDPIVVAAVAGSGGAGALIDMRTRRLPNLLTGSVAMLGLLLAATRLGPVSLPGALAGFAIGLVVLLPAHVIGATGAGDVKFLAALGTLLGPKGVLMAFVYSALAGGVLAVLVALSRRRLKDTLERTAMFVSTRGANVVEIERSSSDNRFAYAPAIAIGALTAALGL
jgi:prepilin peptidase CpaA